MQFFQHYKIRDSLLCCTFSTDTVPDTDNSEPRQLRSKATATYGCTKSELTGAIEQFGILLLKMIESILVKFFRAHDEQEAWWFKVKITPKSTLRCSDDALSALDECPGAYSLSKLLGITMNELWEVLLECKLAKKKGKRGNTPKKICLCTDKDILPVLRDIIKLSKKVKSVDLLKVLHYNDSTTSLVEVPCSAKQSSFKKQAR
jgi:hypothetical protein